jgi:protein disulfide-isomerase
MKSNILLMSVLALAFATAAWNLSGAVAPKADPKAAAQNSKAAWTENIEDAFKRSAETGKPVFINFTGSDWCPWCILADKHIFTRPEWIEFAPKMICLKVDFPKSNRPSKAVMSERHRLAKEFKVRGYPTFVLVSPERKEMTRFVAGRKSAAEFIAEVKKAVK